MSIQQQIQLFQMQYASMMQLYFTVYYLSILQLYQQRTDGNGLKQSEKCEYDACGDSLDCGEVVHGAMSAAFRVAFNDMNKAQAEIHARERNQGSSWGDVKYLPFQLNDGTWNVLPEEVVLREALKTGESHTEIVALFNTKTNLNFCKTTCGATAALISFYAGDVSGVGVGEFLDFVSSGNSELETVAEKQGNMSTIKKVTRYIGRAFTVPAYYNNLNLCMADCTATLSGRIQNQSRRKN